MLLFLLTPPCLGNAAEPPSIIIIVPNAPGDLVVKLAADAEGKARVTDKPFERYYTFYYRDLNNVDDYTIAVSSLERTFQIPLGEPLKTYNNIFTLDLDQQTLEPGKSWSRSAMLVSLRIILTLIIEAAVLWLFGYREKRSWYAFLFINLLTQGALNIWLNEFSPLSGYMVINLVWGEVQVLIVELIVLLAFLREHHRLRTFAYVLTANLLSLIVGGYIITYLPI